MTIDPDAEQDLRARMRDLRDRLDRLYVHHRDELSARELERIHSGMNRFDSGLEIVDDGLSFIGGVDALPGPVLNWIENEVSSLEERVDRLEREAGIE